MPAAGKSERVKNTCGRIVFEYSLIEIDLRVVIALGNNELLTDFVSFFDTTTTHDLNNVTDEIIL